MPPIPVNKRIEALNQEIAAVKSALDAKSAALSAAILSVEKKADRQNAPSDLAVDILKVAQASVAKSLEAVLSSYDSPLAKLVKLVIEQNSAELKRLIDESFSSVIRTEDFKRSLVDAFSHKVSRTIISNNDGLFDKVSNELKNDQIFKAKMSLAVANVVEECLWKK
jgi:hypothetical protein